MTVFEISKAHRHTILATFLINCKENLLATCIVVEVFLFYFQRGTHLIFAGGIEYLLLDIQEVWYFLYHLGGWWISAN